MAATELTQRLKLFRKGRASPYFALYNFLHPDVEEVEDLALLPIHPMEAIIERFYGANELELYRRLYIFRTNDPSDGGDISYYGITKDLTERQKAFDKSLLTHFGMVFVQEKPFADPGEYNSWLIHEHLVENLPFYAKILTRKRVVARNVRQLLHGHFSVADMRAYLEQLKDLELLEIFGGHFLADERDFRRDFVKSYLARHGIESIDTFFFVDHPQVPYLRNPDILAELSFEDFPLIGYGKLDDYYALTLRMITDGLHIVGRQLLLDVKDSNDNVLMSIMLDDLDDYRAIRYSFERILEGQGEAALTFERLDTEMNRRRENEQQARSAQEHAQALAHYQQVQQNF